MPWKGGKEALMTGKELRRRNHRGKDKRRKNSNH